MMRLLSSLFAAGFLAAAGCSACSQPETDSSAGTTVTDDGRTRTTTTDHGRRGTSVVQTNSPKP